MCGGGLAAGHAGLRLHVQEGKAVGGVHGVPFLWEPLHQVLLGNGERSLLVMTSSVQLRVCSSSSTKFQALCHVPRKSKDACLRWDNCSRRSCSIFFSSQQPSLHVIPSSAIWLPIPERVFNSPLLRYDIAQAETLIPVYTSIAEAVKRHPTVSVMVNFSSFRSVYETTMDALNYSDTIKTLAIIAEGVPESQTREIIKAADKKNVNFTVWS